MATQLDYSMTVWIRLISSTGPTGVAEAPEEMLGQNYSVTKIERIEEDDEDEEEDDGDGDADAASGDTLTYALQIDLSFNEHQCDGDEFYEDARAAYVRMNDVPPLKLCNAAAAWTVFASSTVGWAGR